MARTDSPLFSLDASGTVGDAVVYSKWKGINYVRERIIPYNPKSAGQVEQRNRVVFAVDNWQSLTAQNRTDWETARKCLGLRMSGFNLHTRSYINQHIGGADPEDDATVLYPQCF